MKTYYVTDLGSLTPEAISRTGQCITGAGALLWRNFYVTDTPSSLAGGTGVAVNSRGDVAGYYVAGTTNNRAFLKRNGRPIDEITPQLSGTGNSLSAGMNENGDVVGYMVAPPGPTPAPDAPGFNGWLYSGGAATNLTATVDARIQDALGINNGGLIAGRLASGELYTYDVGGEFSPQGVAVAKDGLWINDLDQIAGNSAGDDWFVWQNDGASNFSGGGYKIAGINNAGELVLSNGADIAISDPIAPSGNLLSRPSVHSLNGALNPSGWVVTEASGIDDNGAIVGVGHKEDGEAHGVLLTTAPIWPPIPKQKPSSAQEILFGITNDGSGIEIFIGSGNPTPIGPLGPFWGMLSAAQRDVIVGLGLNAGADLIADLSVRRELRALSVRLIGEASSRLNQPEPPNRKK